MVLQSGPFDGGKQVPHRHSSLASAEVWCINIRQAAIPRLRDANVKSRNSTNESVIFREIGSRRSGITLQNPTVGIY